MMKDIYYFLIISFFVFFIIRAFVKFPLQFSEVPLAPPGGTPRGRGPHFEKKNWGWSQHFFNNSVLNMIFHRFYVIFGETKL